MLSRHFFASFMLSAAIVSLTVESTVGQTLYGSAGSLQEREILDFADIPAFIAILTGS